MALRTVGTVLSGKTSMLEIKTDLKDLSKELKSLSKTGLKRANFRAINKALKKSKTAAKREIADRRFLSAAQVDAGLTLIQASFDRIQAAIVGTGAMIPLTKLKTGIRNPTQTKLGTKVTVAKGNRRLIRGAFVQRMRSGHIGVFIREKKRGGAVRVPRLPIQEQKVPSIAHTLVNEKVQEKVRGVFGTAYFMNLESQYNNEIRKAAARVRR